SFLYFFPPSALDALFRSVFRSNLRSLHSSSLSTMRFSASTSFLLLTASVAVFASPVRFTRRAVNCAEVDDDGSSLISSAPAPEEGFALCTYQDAGECTYFGADGSFSSGSSTCPQGLAQASNFEEEGTTTSTVKAKATQAPPPPPPPPPPSPPPPKTTSTIKIKTTSTPPPPPKTTEAPPPPPPKTTSSPPPPPKTYSTSPPPPPKTTSMRVHPPKTTSMYHPPPKTTAIMEEPMTTKAAPPPPPPTTPTTSMTSAFSTASTSSASATTAASGIAQAIDAPLSFSQMPSIPRPTGDATAAAPVGAAVQDNSSTDSSSNGAERPGTPAALMLALLVGAAAIM
ncbi:hypothetical protein DFH06DRAFT_1379356, partial [Mycena polygramma]